MTPNKKTLLAIGFVTLFLGGFVSGKAYAMLGAPTLLTATGEPIKTLAPSLDAPLHPLLSCYHCGPSYGSCVADTYGDFHPTCRWSRQNGVEICSSNTDACKEDFGLAKQ